MSLSTREMILLIVREANDKGEPICLKDLDEMNLAATPTMCKYVNELIQDGLLKEEYEQTSHGTRKNLYANEEQDHDKQLLLRLIYEISRVGAALETMAGGEARPRIRRNGNGKYIQRKL